MNDGLLHILPGTLFDSNVLFESPALFGHLLLQYL